MQNDDVFQPSFKDLVYIKTNVCKLLLNTHCYSIYTDHTANMSVCVYFKLPCSFFYETTLNKRCTLCKNLCMLGNYYTCARDNVSSFNLYIGKSNRLFKTSLTTHFLFKKIHTITRTECWNFASILLKGLVAEWSISACSPTANINS